MFSPHVGIDDQLRSSDKSVGLARLTHVQFLFAGGFNIFTTEGNND
jgi:hypothetical protein